MVSFHTIGGEFLETTFILEHFNCVDLTLVQCNAVKTSWKEQAFKVSMVVGRLRPLIRRWDMMSNCRCCIVEDKKDKNILRFYGIKSLLCPSWWENCGRGVQRLVCLAGLVMSSLTGFTPKSATSVYLNSHKV